MARLEQLYLKLESPSGLSLEEFGELQELEWAHYAEHSKFHNLSFMRFWNSEAKEVTEGDAA